MSNIYDPKLISDFVQIVNTFERTIRKDERQRLLTKFRENFPATGNQTGLHGEPLNEPPVKKRTRLDDLPPSLAALARLLNERTYPVTVMTVMRELAIPETAARQRITALRKHGYNIELVRQGKRLGKYRIASNR